MNKIFIIPLVLILISGCAPANDRNAPKHAINGDWVSDYFDDGWKKTQLVFSFEDSTCTYLFPYGEFTKYSLSNDTLIIDERVPKKGIDLPENQPKITFKVVELTDDSLTMIPIVAETSRLFSFYQEFGFDTIYLTKTQQKNDVQIERIGFYSTSCFGTCPAMYLEIDSRGNILFDGRQHTEKEGLYSGTIPSSELAIIKNKIHNLEIDSLQERYAATWTDDQACGVMIKTSAGEFQSSAYGFDQEPIELRLLLHKLMQVHKAADMEQDLNISEDFQLPEFQYNAYGPPPPMPSN